MIHDVVFPFLSLSAIRKNDDTSLIGNESCQARESRRVLVLSILKGKWQQKFLSFYLKETPKQYIEVYYRIFISALFGEIF